MKKWDIHIFTFLISPQTQFVGGTHWNHLVEALPMSTTTFLWTNKKKLKEAPYTSRSLSIYPGLGGL